LSAGGQLEQPSEVNNSSTAKDELVFGVLIAALFFLFEIKLIPTRLATIIIIKAVLIIPNYERLDLPVANKNKKRYI
jgi:hypothetical protein